MAKLIHRRTFHAPIATAFFAPPPATDAELAAHHRLAFIGRDVVAAIAELAPAPRRAQLERLCDHRPVPFPWRLGRFNLGG